MRRQRRGAPTTADLLIDAKTMAAAKAEIDQLRARLAARETAYLMARAWNDALAAERRQQRPGGRKERAR